MQILFVKDVDYWKNFNYRYKAGAEELACKALEGGE